MFKKGDIFLYLIILSMFLSLTLVFINMPSVQGSKVEVYVNNKLREVHKLSKEPKEHFVYTDIGGVNLFFYDNGVEVTSSNSPKKLVVKQGFISKSGETLIGVPDKLLIKIVGDNEEQLDYILR